MLCNTVLLQTVLTHCPMEDVAEIFKFIILNNSMATNCTDLKWKP